MIIAVIVTVFLILGFEEYNFRSLEVIIGEELDKLDERIERLERILDNQIGDMEKWADSLKRMEMATM